MIVFGGDRHHMPFNDMFALDLKGEIERQSFMFVRESIEPIEENAGHQQT